MGTLVDWVKDGKKMDLTNMVETTVKFFQKTLELADDKMRGADLEDNKSMEEALKRKAVGTKFILVIDEYTKRDKSTGTIMILKNILETKSKQHQKLMMMTSLSK